MKRNNQPEQRQSSIFIITILAGSILGVVLLGLIAAFFVEGNPSSQYSFTIPNQKTVESEAKLKSTDFIDHYVNYGGKTARFPVIYCDSLGYDFDKYCKPINGNQNYKEIDLTKHDLPVEKIQSAVTDKKDKIAYVIYDDNWSAYVYDLQTKATEKLDISGGVLKNDASVTVVRNFSEQGRYIFFESYTGPPGGELAPNTKSFVYDTQSQTIIPELNNNFIYEILGLGTEDENIVIYYGGCENVDIITEGTFCGDGIYAINTNDGQNMRLNLLEQDHKFNSNTSPGRTRLDYRSNADTLTVTNDDLAVGFEIKNFSKELKILEGETITPKIEQYTDSNAYGTIKKIYQKNGTWYADVDIAEFYAHPDRLEPCKEDGKSDSDCFLVYIRNNSDEVVTFKLADNIQINLTQIIKDNETVGVDGLHSSNLEELEIAIQQGEFHFILEDGVVTEINEQFFS